MWRKYKCYARENVDCSKEKMSVWNRKEVFMFNVKKIIKKISVCCVMAALITGMLSGCGKKNENSKKTDITIFAAKSLNNVMDELCKEYNKEHPDINFHTNYDSSGTLMTQIKEGAKCNVFFSAGVEQMDELEKGYDCGSVNKDNRKDLLNNQVCLVTWKGSNTKVKSFKDMSKAKNMALADETVPVGQYTRKALINEGLVSGDKEKANDLKDTDISKALGDLEINSCANVGAVAAAVAEAADEIGTVYYSDTFGYEDNLEIIEKLPNSLTGDVIYPVAPLKSDDISDVEFNASNEFIKFMSEEKAVKLFEKYHFSMS